MSEEVEFFLEDGSETGERDGITNGLEASEVKTRKAIFLVFVICVLVGWLVCSINY